MDFLTSELTALVSVIVIDLVLAGDNAVVVGLAAAGLPKELRTKAVLYGIIAAAALRIVFALFAVKLLGIIGLTLAGGILLLWVCWKLYREIRSGGHQAEEDADAANALEGVDVEPTSRAGGQKTFRQALTQIVVADVSMSLDNVLAVAGTAREHPVILGIGLVFSVLLMGVAATFIANLLKRFHWISYIGLLLILYVALKMVWEGGFEVMHAAQANGLM